MFLFLTAKFSPTFFCRVCHGLLSFDVSVGFNKSLGKRPLYWGMELGFSTRGYKTNAKWASGLVSETFGDYIGHKIEEKQ